MSLYRYGAFKRLVGKFVIALMVGAALFTTWGCDGGEGVANFKNVALLQISSTTLPAGKVGDAYTATVNASGGAEAGYVWTVIAGTLPTGLTLAPTGTPNSTVSGTPMISGSFLVTIRVQDARGESASAQFSLTIAPATLAIITPNPLPDGNVDKSYSVAITAEKGTGQGYTWNIQPGGQLPAGLTIGATGTPSTTISGIPTDTGSLPQTFTFTVRVTDSGGFTATQQYQLKVNGPLVITTPTQLPDACVGNQYGYQPQLPPPNPPVPPNVVIDATGGTEAGYTWSTAPSVPIPGVTIDAAGLPVVPPATQSFSTTFNGAPTLEGDFNFNVTVDDNGPNQTTKAFAVKVHPRIDVAPNSVPEATVNQAITPVQFTQSGGPVSGINPSNPTPPTYTFSMSGATPPGMQISAAGLFTGTPTTAGTYIFNVVATCDTPWAPFKGTVLVTFTVVSQLDIVTQQMGPMNQNTNFFQLVTATGGTPGSYSWQIIAGALPPPLVLQPSGYPSTNIQGTPINRGPYDFTLQVMDSAGRTASRNYTGIVDYPQGTIQSALDQVGDGRLAAGTAVQQYLDGCGLNQVEDVAVRSNGDVYIADRANHRIRKIDAITGVITTFCGNGTAGFTADGATANDPTTMINYPAGLVIDNDPTHPGAPCLYFSEYNNHRIRRITFSSNTLFTIAGNGSTGYNGVSNEGTPATSKTFVNPRGLALDGQGRVYVASSYHRIRRLTHDALPATTWTTELLVGSTTSTTVGNFNNDGIPGGAISASSIGILNNPHGVQVNAGGTFLLIADTNNQRIRRVDLTTSTITTVAGTGTAGYNSAHEGVPATSATLWTPRWVALDPSGDYYIADQGGHRLRKVTAAGNITTLLGTITSGGSPQGITGDGSPLSTSTTLTANPSTVHLYSSGGTTYLYFAQWETTNDFAFDAVRRVDLTNPPNIVERVAGWGGVVIALNPQKVVQDKAGNIYIADTQQHRVLRYDPDNDILTCVCGNGNRGNPASLPAAPIGTVLYQPYDVAINPDPAEEFPDGSAKFVYIADYQNRSVRKVDLQPGGQMTSIAGTQGASAPPNNPGDGGPANQAEIGNPLSLAFDQNNRLYIGTTGTHGGIGHYRVRRLELATLVIFTYVNTNGGAGIGTNNGPAGGSLLHSPWGLSCDANYLYICVQPYHNIRRVGLVSDNIEHFAGQEGGGSGSGGDGAPAAVCQFSNPRGVSVDASGNVYIADGSNHRIRKVTASTLNVTTIAGTGSPGYNPAQDGGQATSAQLNNPHGAFITSDGASLWIADYANSRIRRVVKP